MRNLPEINWWLLALIIVWALALRIYGLDYSFSSDELSALSRTAFDNIDALAQHGVMADFHPALVQFFLYLWTSVVPETEFAVRFPFVLLGVGSILMVYLVSKEWFGSQPALLTAAAMAGLQFFIMYSQLARPYSPGLFFTWWMTLHWTHIVKNKGGYAEAFLCGLATALAMYTHYFSFMQVLIIFLLGLVWIDRRNFRYYAIASVTALLLWLPHIAITAHHFEKNMLGSSLAAPETDFIWTFLLFVFNDSSGILILLFLAGFVGFSFNLPRPATHRWQIVCLVLFAIPFAISYYYSRLINPVLQYSTLLFAAPSLLILLFSFTNKLPKKILVSLIVLLLSGTTFSTVIINKYYSSESFGEFRKLAEKIISWEEKYGTNNILKVANFNSPGYLTHYFKRLDHPTELEPYDLEPDTNLAKLKGVLQKSSQEYMAFAWSKHDVPLEAYLIIRSEYPFLVDEDPHFDSGVYLYSRNNGQVLQSKYSFSVLDSLDSKSLRGLDKSKILGDSLNTRYRMTAQDEYAFYLEYSATSIPLSGGDIMVAVANVRTDPHAEVTLVIEILSTSGESTWYGRNLHPAFSNEHADNQEMFAAIETPEELSESDQIKVYLWKRSKTPMVIDELKVHIYPYLGKNLLND